MGSKQIQDFDATTLVDTDYIVVQTSSGVYKKVDGAQLRALRSVEVGDISFSLEHRTLSSDVPYLDLAIPSRNLDIANFLDYVPYLRDIQAGLKWTSTQITGTVTIPSSSTAGSTTVLGSGTNLSADMAAGNLIFIEKLNQFRYIATVTSTIAATIDEPGNAAAGADIYKISRSTAYNADFSFTAAQVMDSTTFSLFVNYGVDTQYPENYILLQAIAEAYACDREYGTITLPSSFGGVPAGDYQITSVTLANVGSSSPAIVCECSGLSTGALSTGSGTLNVYPHRIAGSTTTARHYEITDAAVMGDGMYNVLGMRTRDYVQGHIMYNGLAGIAATTPASIYGATTDDIPGLSSGNNACTVGAGDRQAKTSPPRTDGTNETPRTGPRTKPRASIFNIYAYVGTYSA